MAATATGAGSALVTGGPNDASCQGASVSSDLRVRENEKPSAGRPHGSRVLIVSQYYWPESFRINDVAQSLADGGFEVSVLTGKPNYPRGSVFPGYAAWGCTQETHRGVGLFRVPLLPRGASRWRLALNYLSFVASGVVFGPQMLRAKRFDVLFVYGMSPILQALPALFLGWLRECPVIIWVQDQWPESLSATGYVRSRAVLGVVRRIVRFIYARADLLLVQSQALVPPVAGLAGGTPVAYCPNSVDDAFAVPVTGEVPPVVGLGEGFSVVYAGNIGAAQAVAVIVEAASLLRDHPHIRFVVLGDGSSRDWMLSEVRRRGLTNLHLPGRYPVETMPGFMQRASALLVTLADRPVFAATVPNRVQAYLAAGRPIIACLNGEGARLVVEAQAGLATPAEDAHGLARTILRLAAQSHEDLDEMGRNGRKYFQAHFNHSRVMEQLIAHVQAVAHPGQGGQ